MFFVHLKINVATILDFSQNLLAKKVYFTSNTSYYRMCGGKFKVTENIIKNTRDISVGYEA